MTNHWYFVAAAYGVTAFGTLAVLWQSLRAMRLAEAAVTALSAGNGEAGSVRGE